MSIHKIGVELEGQWNERPEGFEHDGSVGGFVYVPGSYIGEVPSPPLLRADLNAWMNNNYPDQVNQSCGLHVHVSVESKAEYSLLMTHAAQLERDLIQNVKTWATEREIIKGHSLWERLAGNSRWCQQGTHSIDQQVRARRKIGARYRMLNFCWGLHGTVEVRLLPGFKKKHLGIEAVNVVVSTIDHALTHYSGIPKEITRETNVGVVECHAWKQGFTCFLDSSQQVKQEIYSQVYGRQKSQAILARLLKRERVTIPVMTLDNLTNELDHVAEVLDRFQVTVSRIPNPNTNYPSN